MNIVFFSAAISNTFRQSHTGVTMANAFQAMLERFGLTEKIHGLNADNASANDTQTVKLNGLENSFEEDNRVRCFNHTLQLSAKALLKPFNTALSGKTTDDNDACEVNDNDRLMPEIDEDEDDEDDNDDEEVDVEDSDDQDDGVDELQELSEAEQIEMLENTADVREIVTKVTTHLHLCP
jgi:hypothetical protein